MIKNFKVNLRQGYIFRELKKRKIAAGPEEEFTEKLKEIQSRIKPATVYDSFKPEIFRSHFDAGKALVVSLFAVTLGNAVETPEKNEITDASLKDGLDVAKNFVTKLIQIEAEEEHCELMEPVEMEPEKIFKNQKILKTLDFSKIDIKFQDNVISPENTKFFTINWILKKKK